MALSVKAKENNLIVVDNIDLGEMPKTKKALEVLSQLGIKDYKVLVVLPEKDEVVYKSFRNLQNVKVLPVMGINVYDVLWADKLLITEQALEKIYERLGT